MADSPDETRHRTRFRSAPGEVQLREQVDGDDGMMALRIPIASSGEVRNEGDDPLTDDELRGMAEQVNDLTTGVFPEHGMSSAIDGGGSYSQFEKLGYWSDGEIESEASTDGEDLLMATARMPDPETLPPETNEYRTALAILKEQAKRDIPIDASIGWREDDAYPGGVDLLEASIVGIGADPRTNSSSANPVAAVTRAAVESGADPGDLLDRVEAALSDADRDTDARPFGPPNAPNLWDDFEECVADVEEWDGIDDPEAFCGWAEEQTGAADETDNHDMTDESDTEPTEDQTADDPDESQSGEDETTDQRAPEDIGPADFAEFVAAHYDGLDAADVTDALDEAGGDYVGEVDVPELSAFVASVTDSDTETVAEYMDDLMAEEQGEDMDGEDDEGEDDEDEQSADADEDRSADDDGPDIREEVRALAEEFEEFRESVRAGEAALDVPGDDEDAEDEQRDADADGDESAETYTDPHDGIGDYL